MASIKDIAEAVGVSPSTVSRVINGKSYVNEATRQKVQDMLARTGYQSNALAKSLKLRRSNTICLMLPSIDNLIFPAITRGVEAVARKHGFMVVLCNTDEDCEAENVYIEKMKARWIDGFLLCCNAGHHSSGRKLREEGFPVVIANRFTEEDVRVVDTVAVDNFRAAYTATRYLLRSGRRRIALAYGREELFLYRERYRGYCQALRDAGVPYDDRLVLREVNNGTDSFYQLTRNAMALPDPPDAFFATSDPKAFVILHALHELGVRIPEQVSVMGFDNVGLSSMVEPPLSTISQPLREIGVAAAKSLIRQIEYKDKNGELPPPVQTVLDVDLIIRGSTD